jgi:hypothetical protein
MNPNEAKPPRTLFYLPQLPKADYKLLEALRKPLDATQLEVLMVGLHLVAQQPPRVRRHLLRVFRANAPTDQDVTINEDDSTTDEHDASI